MNSHLRPLLHITGSLCMFFSLSVLPAMLVSLIYRDGELSHLILSFLLIFLLGLVLWGSNNGQRYTLRGKDGFLVVSLFWVLLGGLGMVPFMLSLHVSVVDALFESISGLTTTGATVFSQLDHMQPSILFYRQELQWLGGMGLIVLAIAVLPMLGVGGMSLYKAETPGPMKEDKIMPRLYMASRIMWFIYVGLTLVCALSYWLAGMTFFDAVSHSLSTVSTGGFSTHDDSLGFFHSSYIDDIAVIFMMLGSINFGIHYAAISGRSMSIYLKDMESRYFIFFVVAMIAVVALSLWINGYNGKRGLVETSMFEVVSIVTTTGFGIDDFSVWPVFLPFFLMMISFVGGCGGSTAGGVKVMRISMLVRLGYREILQLVHPRGQFSVRVGNTPIPDRTLQSILGFFSVYVTSFVVLVLLLIATAKTDQVTAFSAIATCINNTGPGLRDVALSFTSLNDSGKIISIIAMLLGRLEILSVLVLFHPEFWRS